MNLKQIIAKLSKYCPLCTQEEWDYSGYQTGEKHNREVKKILLALDFTEKVYEAALDFNPDLILTHHPFFFGRKEEIMIEDPLKAELTDKVNSSLHCPIYSYHTNFDKAPYGMNYSILNTMGFKDIKSIEDSFLWVADAESPITYEELVTKFIDFTGFNYLLGLKNSSEKIKKIAFVAGSGSSEFHKAIELGVDCFVTGDCPHHVRLDLNRYKMNYIEVPHEIEEKGFLLGMSEILSNIDNSFNIKKYRFEKPFELLGVAYDK